MTLSRGGLSSALIAGRRVLETGRQSPPFFRATKKGLLSHSNSGKGEGQTRQPKWPWQLVS
jgi:hypothetical protein